MTLDDDVAAGLEREVRRSGRTYRAVVNAAIRLGLERKAATPAAPFVVEPADLGLRDGLELDDIEGLLDRVEGEPRR